MIGISVDNRWSLRAFKRDEGLTATLLSDFHPKGNVAQKYGVFIGRDRLREARHVRDRQGRAIRRDHHQGAQGAAQRGGLLNLLRNCPR